MHCRDPIRIFDCKGRNFIHMGGKPRQKSFQSSLTDLVNTITSARSAAGIPNRLPDAVNNNRGDHPSATYGYTYPTSKQVSITSYSPVRISCSS